MNFNKIKKFLKKRPVTKFDAAAHLVAGGIFTGVAVAFTPVALPAAALAGGLFAVSNIGFQHLFSKIKIDDQPAAPPPATPPTDVSTPGASTPPQAPGFNKSAEPAPGVESKAPMPKFLPPKPQG